MTSLDHIAHLDQMLVQQTFALLVNKYRISTVNSDGSEGQPLAFVQQKRLKVREQVEFYADETKQQPLLRLKAKSLLEVRGRSQVQLPDGTVVGHLQKVFGKSLFRSTWQLLDADGNLTATAQESSLAVALFRRFYGFIPYLGSLPLPIPFHFDIDIEGRTVGTYRRLFSLRDRYVLDLRGDNGRVIDRRVAMGFAIALDALQDR